MKFPEFAERHCALCKEALDLSARKGHDYSGEADTLLNLKATGALSQGAVTPEQGVLVRLGDKLGRLWSLTAPGAMASVADESIRDTLVDIINYACLLEALRCEGNR